MRLLKKYLKNEKGSGALITFLFSFFFICIIAYVGIDIGRYVFMKMDLRLAVNETLEITKAQNGFDPAAESAFYDLVDKLGRDSSQSTVNGTSKLVQRGTPVVVIGTLEYETFALKPFGKTIKLTIREEAHGLASTYVR